MMNATIKAAAEVIAEVSPFLASQFIAKPLHRRTVVNALFEKMKADGREDAYRVRVVLNRALDAAQLVTN